MSAHHTRTAALATVASGALLIVATTLETGGASAATVAYAWQARIGSGVTNMASLQVYSAGNGVLRLRATETKLRARSRFAVTIHKGTCGMFVSSLGPTLVTLPSVTTGGVGAVSRTLAVTTAQAKKVRSAWNAGAGVTLVLAGASTWCFPFGAAGAIGKAIRLGDEQVHTVTRAEHWSGTGRSTLKAGSTFVTFHVRITARTATSYDERSYGLRDRDGTDWTQPLPMWEEREPALGSGDLAPGDTVEGWVTSVAPESDHDSLVLVLYMGSSLVVVLDDAPDLYVPLGPLSDEGSGAAPSPPPVASASPSPLP